MTRMHPRIGIEFISVLGMPPRQFVAFAADMGCSSISLALQPMFAENPHGYPAWSLRNDAALRRETIAALHDRGVRLSMGEGFLARPDADIDDCVADLDLMLELGAQRVNIVSIDSDVSRTFDQCARFAALANERNMDAVIEYLPGMAIGHLAMAVAAVTHAANPRFGVLVDAMHFFRSGSQPADLQAVDPALIAYAQICDVPRVSAWPDYFHEARFERLPPGQGELPLQEFLAAIPADRVIGIEVPMLTAATAGVSPAERIAQMVVATSGLLARCGP